MVELDSLRFAGPDRPQLNACGTYLYPAAPPAHPDVGYNDHPRSFDIRKAPYARGYFLGDYMGLSSAGNDFLPVFGQAFAQNDANQYMSRLSP